MGVKVADKFVAMGDFELLDAQDVLVDIGGTPKRLQEAIDNGELGGGGSSHTHDNKTVLDSITAEKVEAWDKAEENVQSDWNETDDTADGFIKNKPTIPDITGMATETYVDNKVADYTKTVDLADVATSGSYNDLADKPTIPEAYDDTALSNRVKTIEDDYAKSSDIPSLSGYATETWVNEQGFLTQHQDISGKVDKVEGKSLISDTEITRLASVDNYDDTDIRAELANKADTTAIPSKVSVLENDSKYQTESDVTTTLTDYATKTYVGEQITNAEHLKREIVTVLPSDTEASDNIIYMLKIESTTGNDKYQEYMKIDGTVQIVGDTSVDLTDYAKSADIPTTVAELTDSGDYAKITDIQKKLDKTFTGADVADKVLKTDSLGNVVLGTYDDTISNTSTNAVQNKVIKTELDKKFDIAQSIDKAGYVAVIGDDGNMTFTEPTTLGDNSQTLTEAEYLALPEEQKLNNSYYLYDIGVHYKNGVAYSRKKPIQLTMEEYKALGEVDPDQEYIVSADAEGILLGAEDIGYNNAESGIQATTVQGAIDKVVEKVDGAETELKGSIKELNSNLSKCFNYVNYTSVYCNGDSDVYLIPPSNSGNYIPILAQPKSTWNTVPFIYFHSEFKEYYLHTKGSDAQSYDVTWILSKPIE